MGASAVICFKCRTSNPVMGSVGRRDECFKCKWDLHACKNCLHYDPKAYNSCKETQADVVQEKERSNFCDYFTPGAGLDAGAEQEKLLSAAEALFKKK